MTRTREEILQEPRQFEAAIRCSPTVRNNFHTDRPPMVGDSEPTPPKSVAKPVAATTQQRRTDPKTTRDSINSIWSSIERDFTAVAEAMPEDALDVPVQGLLQVSKPVAVETCPQVQPQTLAPHGEDRVLPVSLHKFSLIHSIFQFVD